MNKFTGVRHGEVALIPFRGDLSKFKDILHKGDYILAHSETGHHHVLEGTMFQIMESDDNRVLAKILGVTNLAHRKTFDKHRTIAIPSSLLERYEMVEYNPASKAIQSVKD